MKTTSSSLGPLGRYCYDLVCEVVEKRTVASLSKIQGNLKYTVGGTGYAHNGTAIGYQVFNKKL